jgi:hypothetical protein
MKKLFLALLIVYPLAALAQPRLVPHSIATKDGRKFALNLPADFEIIPAAEGLKRVRFFAKAPDGRIFVTDMYNLTDNKRGAIIHSRRLGRATRKIFARHSVHDRFAQSE